MSTPEDQLELEDSETPESYPTSTTSTAQSYAERILEQGLQASEATPDLLMDISKNAEAAREVLRQARERLRARRDNSRADSQAMLAQGFSKPSRNFAEMVANVAGAGVDARKRQQEESDLRDKNELGIDQALLGVDSDILKNKLELLKLGSSGRAVLMKEALRTLGASTKPGAGGKPASTFGKIAADMGYLPGTPEFNAKVSQLQAQDARNKAATAQVDVEGETDPRIFSTLGVPRAAIDPYAGLGTRSQQALRQAEAARAEKALQPLQAEQDTAQQALQDADRFLELNKSHPTGPSQGGDIPFVGGAVSWATGFSPEAKEMDAITARISRRMRVPGEGQTSDFDAKQFIRATMGRDKPYETNKNIIEGFKAQQQRILEKSDFLNDYFSANGHLRGAQSAWSEYLRKNPIFDPKAPGKYQLNPNRKSYQEYFRERDSKPAGYAEGGEVESEEDRPLVPDLLRSGIQGTTFGLGDEALGQLPGNSVENERAELLRGQGAHPISSAAAQGAGTTATLLALGRLIAKNKGMTDAALRLVPERELIRLALMGVGTGSLEGFASGEGSNRDNAALSGAMTGALYGTAGGLGAKYGYASLENRLDALRGLAIPKSDRRLTEALSEDNPSIADAFAKLRRLRRSGTPATLLDTGGRKTQALGEAVAQHQNPESRGLVEDLDTRMAGTRERVADQVNRGLKPDEYFSKMSDLQQELARNSKPLYDTAYQQFPAISSPELDKILSTPDGRRALQMATRLAGNAGIPTQPISLYSTALGRTQQKNSGMPLELYDYVKRGFDQLIRGEEANGPTTLGHSLRSLRTSLRDQLDRITGGDQSPYKAARQQYAGDLEVLDALKSGREDFNSLTPEEVKNRVANMSFAEKDAFRSGVAQKLFESITNPTSDINAARKVIGSPATSEKLATLFDTPAQFNLFKTALEKEMEMFDKSKAIVRQAGRSATSAAGRSNSLLSKIDPEFSHTPWGWTPTTWVLNLIRQRPLISDETAEGIAKSLRTTNPSELANLESRLTSTAERLKGKKGRAGKAGLIGAAVAAGLGAPPPEGHNLEEEPPVRKAQGGKIDVLRKMVSGLNLDPMGGKVRKSSAMVFEDPIEGLKHSVYEATQQGKLSPGEPSLWRQQITDYLEGSPGMTDEQMADRLLDLHRQLFPEIQETPIPSYKVPTRLSRSQVPAAYGTLPREFELKKAKGGKIDLLRRALFTGMEDLPKPPGATKDTQLVVKDSPKFNLPDVQAAFGQEPLSLDFDTPTPSPPSHWGEKLLETPVTRRSVVSGLAKLATPDIGFPSLDLIDSRVKSPKPSRSSTIGVNTMQIPQSHFTDYLNSLTPQQLQNFSISPGERDVFSQFLTLISSATPKMRKFLKSKGLYYHPKSKTLYYSPENTNTIREETGKIVDEYEGESEFDPEDPESTWERYGLGGDDDVDYNGSYIDAALDALDDFHSKNHPPPPTVKR